MVWDFVVWLLAFCLQAALMGMIMYGVREFSRSEACFCQIHALDQCSSSSRDKGLYQGLDPPGLKPLSRLVKVFRASHNLQPLPASI